jgi:DNA-binding response OmpR family regulator
MKRALVVDDELDICLMVTKYLQNLHFETHYALTVKEALRSVSAYSYELIFVDLNLPDGSGFDVIHHIGKVSVQSKIIVISAHDNESMKALENGANLFISKPFTIKTINEGLKVLHLIPNGFSQPSR